VTLADSAQHPGRLHAHPPGAPAQRAGGHFNDALLARCSPRRTEEAWVTGALGEKVQVWLTCPPGFDRRRKWPLMHNIHGGPHTGRRRHLALPLEHAGLRRRRATWWRA
jgi:dipeptidyl aminopeptidase/acylaminoacyl peptidase